MVMSSHTSVMSSVMSSHTSVMSSHTSVMSIGIVVVYQYNFDFFQLFFIKFYIIFYFLMRIKTFFLTERISHNKIRTKLNTCISIFS